VKNKTNTLLNGIKVSHGPLPFGATYDSTKSTGNCVDTGQSIDCLLSLGPNESKSITLGYRMKSSLNCLLAKVLQKAKTTVGQVTGTTQAEDQVSTSVTCSMQSIESNSSQGQGTGSVGNAMGNGLNGSSGGSGSWMGTNGMMGGAGAGQVGNGLTGSAGGSGVIVGANGMAGGQVGGADGQTKGGFKPYRVQPLPKTGAAHAYFSPFSATEFVSLVHVQEGTTWVIPFTSTILTTVLFTLLVLKVFPSLNKAKSSTY